MEKMDISFITLTWNSEKYISKFIEGLINNINTNDFQFEIFIIDNGSIDRTVEIIKSLRRKYNNIIIPIYLKKNYGTTYSRNLALSISKGDYICIIDSDVEIKENVFSSLINELKKNNMIALIAPKLVYPSGKVQKSTDNFPTLFSKIKRYFFLKIIEKKEGEAIINSLNYVDYVISAFWILPKRIIETVGLLDEKIFYAPEDVDYCLRIRKKGYKIAYLPTVSVVHHTQELSRGFKINKTFFMHVNGLIYYFIKHKYFITRPYV